MREGLTPRLSASRRGSPGAAGRSLPTWGGRERLGHPPPSASPFSPPLRRLPPSLPARLPGMVEGAGQTRRGGPGRGGRLGGPQPPPPVMAKDVLGGGSRGGC